MNLVLLGPAGSGKGTLAAKLAQRHNLRIFDTGAALRSLPPDTDIGCQVAELLRGGNMAPNHVTISAVRHALEHASDTGQGWLFDGFPRNIVQSRATLDMHESGLLRIDRLIVLHAPDDVVAERLTGRSTCAKCGTIYNATTCPPGDPCPEGGACDLLVRNDDTPEGIARRLEIFKASTEPGISLIEEAGVPTLHVDATQSRDAIYRFVVAALRRPRRSSLLV